jgi:hypothetical protein
MTFPLPSWITAILAEHDAASAELVLTWPWSTAFTIPLAMGLAWLIWSSVQPVKSASRVAMSATRTARCLAIFMLIVMLTQTAIRTQRSGLPPLAVVVDRSASMSLPDADGSEASRKDSTSAAPMTRLAEVQHLLLDGPEAILPALRERYAVELYTIDDKLIPLNGRGPDTSLERLVPEGQPSRLGSGISGVLARRSGPPPAAIVYFTDGVANIGASLANAAQFARETGVPLHFVAVGRDTLHPDLALSELVVDGVVRVGEVSRFDFRASSQGFTGGDAMVELFRDDTAEPMASMTLDLSEASSGRHSLLSRMDTAGDFHFTLRASAAGDSDSSNDVLRCGVRVIPSRIRVLYVQSAPSFEYRFLKSLLERDESVEPRCILQEADPEYSSEDRYALRVFPVTLEELGDFDVFILGDCDPAQIGTRGLNDLYELVTRQGRGIAFISGPRFMPTAFEETTLSELFPMYAAASDWETSPSADGDSYEIRPTALGADSPITLLGESVQNSLRIWNELPGPRWLVMGGKRKPASLVLLEGEDPSRPNGEPIPLAFTQYVGAGRVLFHATDETWRWRFRQGEPWHARYWGQAIRFLAGRESSPGAVITTDQREYPLGEPVRFQLRFGPPARVPEAGGPVGLEWRLPDGTYRPLELSQRLDTPDIFEGSVPDPPLGTHQVRFDGAEGTNDALVEFTVVPRSLELERVVADIAEMSRAASISGGHVYRPREVHELLKKLPSGQSVPLAVEPPVPIWNTCPVLLLFLLSLSADWITRKRWGLR